MRTLKGFLYLILGGTLCGWMFNRIAAWFIDNPLTVGSNHTVAEWAVILQDPFYLDSRTMPFFFLAFGALALVTMTKYDWTGEREEQKKLRGEESGVADDYDYILIDCPPSLGLLTVNALTAADYLLIPTMAETFAASGITQLYDTYRSVKKYTNPALKIDGVLLTRTERTRVTKTIQELTGKIAEYMGADVYRTTIRSNVIIKEAQAAQENVFDYVEGKSQTKGERVTESSRNFVGDCLAFVREFVEKEREQ